MRRPAASLPPFVVLAGLAFLAAPGRAGVTPGGDAIEPGTDTIATLVERLGDADYNVRENAAAELQAIGPAAVDALLSAAETAADLEVSMRARWIVEAIPLEMVHDTPEAARLLEAYNGQGFEQRVKVMHRLLRLDDDSGIEALARIVRLERSAEGSRLAAALLAREWHPGDRWWPVIAERTLKGLGRTHRPAGAFLRALAEFSMATDPEIRRRSIAAAREAFDALERAAPGRTPASEDDEEDELFVRRSDASAAEATTTLARCLVRMLIADGRREEALDLTARLATAGDASRAVARTVDWLAWATDAGIPELVDRLDGTGPDARPADPLVTWAAAAAWRARGDAARAGALADAAFARHKAAIAIRDLVKLLPAAIFLARMGCDDWAVRCYDALLDDPRTTAGVLAYTAVLAAEYLHELGRDTEAAACLGRLFAPGPGRREINAEQALAEIGRDHRTILARMQYFASCAAAARGDGVERRRLLENALREQGKEIDSLIALCTLPDNTPDQQSDARRRTNEALRQIENEIHSMPEDSNSLNEWAWLAANTGGDAEKATRYSRQSLVKLFDNSSYLDTLAHCRAAAGDLSGALRWQTLAVRQEPHNVMIRANLQRFEARAAADGEGR